MTHQMYEFKEVERHYTQSNLERAIFEALEEAGKDPNQLTLPDLAPIDEFHIRGREATEELASEIGLDSEKHVLDVGCGLGGPSRRLASQFGCRVTGLDLTEEYCRVAEVLSKRLGLDQLVSYIQGNALEMPFDDATFDVVWTQHASMNIPDKVGLYNEIYRVLKSGGYLAIYDILAGPGGEIYFPVPWAQEASISFLVSPDELHQVLEQSGFEIVSWRDTTEVGRSWFEAIVARNSQEDRPATGIHILLGKDFPVMMQNQMRNLNENRTVLIEVIAVRS